MLKAELQEIIRNGESSGVEFKLDAVQKHDLAKEFVAFANFTGGVVLLGVGDDGSIHGIARGDLERWVTDLCRDKIDPPVIPYFEVVRDVEPGRHVAIVRILQGPNKPYARVHENRRTYYIRVGTTSRETSREELERMFQESGRLRFGQKPLPGSTIDDLDSRRLVSYFKRVLRQPCPADSEREAWADLLVNLELAGRAEGTVVVTVDGMLLFGRDPKRFLPQSGIRAIAYSGQVPDYSAQADEDLKGAITPVFGPRNQILEAGLIEQTMGFIERYARKESRLVRGRRVDKPAYPEVALREALVNAVAHRDYSVAGTDIMLNVFEDRIEVVSPGRLPNTATVEAIKSGYRYARNQTLVNVLRDYGYVDARGMGIRHKMIPAMRAYNETEPDLIATEHNFTVRLWRRRVAGAQG